MFLRTLNPDEDEAGDLEMKLKNGKKHSQKDNMSL
ncbi:hypothetical protein Lser_V15G32179 [Lactuca serriola]